MVQIIIAVARRVRLTVLSSAMQERPCWRDGLRPTGQEEDSMDEGQGKTPAEEETWRQWLGRETREAVSSLFRLLGVTVLAIVGALVVALLWFIFTMKSPTPEEMVKRKEAEKLRAEQRARDFPPIKFGEPGRELFYELLGISKEKEKVSCGKADVTPVLRKYIKNGDSIEKTKEFLAKNWFRLYDRDKYVAAYYMLSPDQMEKDHSRMIRFGNELYIQIDCKDRCGTVISFYGVMTPCLKSFSYPESRTLTNHSEE